MNKPGVARFYSGDKCIEEIPCATEKEAEGLADSMYQQNHDIDDWSWKEDEDE